MNAAGMEIGTMSPEVELPIMAWYITRSVPRSLYGQHRWGNPPFVNSALDVIITRPINSAP